MEIEVGKIIGFWEVLGKCSASGKSDKSSRTRCICLRCNTEHSINSYNLKNGKTSKCRYCYGKSCIGSGNFQWKGYGEIPRKYFTRLIHKAKLKNKEFLLTQEYIWNLFLKQDKKCALSGVEIKFSSCCKEQTASLDRIDSSKGYIENNVQWVHVKINIMKNVLSDEEFLMWCKTISDYNK